MGNEKAVRQMMVSGVLITLLVTSCIAMEMAFRSGHVRASRWFGMSAAVLVCASSLSVAVIASGYVARRRALRSEVADPKEYRAAELFKNRVVFVLLTIAYAGLVFVVYAKGHSLWLKILLSVALVFCAGNSYRFLFRMK